MEVTLNNASHSLGGQRSDVSNLSVLVTFDNEEMVKAQLVQNNKVLKDINEIYEEFKACFNDNLTCGMLKIKITFKTLEIKFKKLSEGLLELNKVDKISKKTIQDFYTLNLNAAIALNRFENLSKKYPHLLK